MAHVTFDYTPDHTGGDRQYTSSVQDRIRKKYVIKSETSIFLHRSYQVASLPVAHVKWE